MMMRFTRYQAIDQKGIVTRFCELLCCKAVGLRLMAVMYSAVFVLFLNSCNAKRDDKTISRNEDSVSLVNELIQSGFLLYVDSSKLDSMKLMLINNGDIFRPEAYRFVNIDAEELAEGSFDFFRGELTEILKRRGLELTFSTTENFENLHEVMINDELFVLFDDSSLADYSFWNIAPRRFFGKINQELEKSKSQERFYLMYGGNDLGAILLTERQFNIIATINKGNTKEIPYTP